jgi:excisionase family DNA binding protein
MDSNEKWYAVKEVAAQLGVSCDTVRRRIRRKLLRALKFSEGSDRRHRTYECFRIAASELDRYIRARMTF